jgi:amino acid transporter
LINLSGVTYGSWTVNFLTVAKLLPLLAFIGAGLFYLDPGALTVQLPEETQSIREAALLLIFAYGGFENASIPSEEVRSPTRNLPVALLVSVTVTTVIYILIQIVAQGHLPELAVDRTPLASAAQNFMGSAGGALITCGAIVSTLGSNSAVALVGPRILYALAEDKQLPAPLARVHPRLHTPHVSITVFAIVVWAIALYGRFAELVAVSATARLLFSAATCIAVPVLRHKLPHAKRGFKLKGGLLVPGLAALVSLWLLSGVSRIQAILGALALVVGIVVFAINRLFQREAPGKMEDRR